MYIYLKKKWFKIGENNFNNTLENVKITIQ